MKYKSSLLNKTSVISKNYKLKPIFPIIVETIYLKNVSLLSLALLKFNACRI